MPHLPVQLPIFAAIAAPAQLLKFAAIPALTSLAADICSHCRAGPVVVFRSHRRTGSAADIYFLNFT
jgi:hypothetical protein